MNAASITTDRFGDLVVRFDYDPAVVAELKRLPKFSRRWDPTRKVWRVDAAYHDDVVDILGDFGLLGGSAAPARTGELDEFLVGLLRALPEGLRPAVHRALVGAVHPDRGGDHDVAVAVNRAWEKVA